MFLLIAPGTVAGLLPWYISRYRMQAPFFGIPVWRVLGTGLLAVGLIGLLDSFARFALEGFGTPAPVYPTRELVVSGLYRYVRNPMYVAILALVIGQGLILGDARLLWYAAFLWLGFHLFVLAYEEPTLRSRYGGQYDAYCKNVRRWIPRLRPWRQGSVVH